MPTDHLPAPDLGRERRLFTGLAAAYGAAFALLWSLGYFGFVWKTLILPSFFLVAWLAGRFRGFVRDWAPYLAAIVLFDSCRGLIFGMIYRLGLPVYMGYAIDAERALFGEAIPSRALQQALVPDGHPGVLERVLVAVHASHFVVFLGFGLLVWLVRAEAFPRLRFAFVLLMATGLAGYLLVPTVPPWMAAEHFGVLEGIAHLSARVYNVSLPTLARSFDINPVAAMPSLHAGFPVLLTLLCFRHFGRWGWVMVAYTAAVIFGIVYLGEHYVVDVLAGVALAVAAYLVAYRWRRLDPRLDREGRTAAAPAGPGSLMRPLAVAAPLLGLALLLGLAAQRSAGRFVPNEAFIARELEGKSPMIVFYRALLAHRHRDYRQAQPLFAAALGAIRDSSRRELAMTLLGESAYHNGDYATVVAALRGRAGLWSRHEKMLERARGELDGTTEGREAGTTGAHR
jgi:membrane-associated phospholipid phosphatase